MIFKLEDDRDYIKKLIINTINEKLNDSTIDVNDMIVSSLEKLIIGNFDNKYFKFSNSDMKSKLIRSIKLILVKMLNLMNV